MNNHLALLAYTKELLSKEFEMTNSGEIAYCLGIQVKQNRKFKNIHLSQDKYFNDIFTRFKMDSCHLVTPQFQASFKLNKSMAPITIEDVIAMKDIPFKTIVGIIMHVMVCTRLDFAYLYDLSKVTRPCSKLHVVIMTKT
jgi:hypothetical protein